jgi:hypothetical protein
MGIKRFGRVLKDHRLGRPIRFSELVGPIVVDLDNLLHKFWRDDKDAIQQIDRLSSQDLFQYIYQQRFEAVWERLTTMRAAFAARNQRLIFISKFKMFWHQLYSNQHKMRFDATQGNRSIGLMLAL